MKNLRTVVIAMLLSACAVSASAQSKKEVANAKKQLQEILKSQAETQAHLVKFDTLDFVVYSTQNWKRLHESHAKNIKVTYPDGSVTVGLDEHIKQLSPMFTFAPDTKITEHPIRFGAGTYTAVTGYIEGTFSKPMMLPNGGSIPATGKKFKLPMCTIGLWKDGVMYEEQLFWDNQAFMKQIGLGN
ncbi:SnoaL-like polyketide cyclase [Flexibacter flexilis DSM 6793]|uniref:SnoaL-like polyketide cyclase n=1 Tax=Flexibacter flexilis DSM 6793 TaxID=927664 RepID=A0A1I1NNM6_9BACT|nr:ester cyclase [Flexibacter flexilis]SFC99127.1 SnoaL-like polyketide cyclase [Flexibacter flexilis DSM 6793]